MAVTSGSFTTSAYDGVRSIKFNWSLSRQDISGNYSVINYSFVGSGSSSGTWYYTQGAYLNINGERRYTQPSGKVQLDVGTVLASGQMIIYHNSDGSKTFSADGGGAIYNYGVTQTGSNSWQLPTIARASTPSVSGTLELGNELTINVSRASSSFTHNIYVSWGNQISNQRILTGIGTSGKWTIPKDYANYIPYGVTGTLYITCETYNGSTKIGDKTINVTISVPNTIEFKPSIDSIFFDEAGVPKDYGFKCYVQNYSKVRYVISADGAYGSIIKSYIITIDGTEYNISGNPSEVFVVGTSEILTNSGTRVVTIKIVDTRGREAIQNYTIDVVPYGGPKISADINRCNVDWTLNDEGDYGLLNIYFRVPYISSKENTFTYSLKMRTKDSTTWIDKTDQILLNSDGKTTEYYRNYSSESILSVDGNNEYVFLITLKDLFEEVSYTFELGTAFQLVNYNVSGKGIAFGKVSQKDAFEINMDIYDKFEQLITNGLAEYGNINPNTTLSHLILTEKNTPNNDGFYYIMTIFYSTKSTTTNRTQLAIPYIYDIGSNKRHLYIRQCINGTWNSWYSPTVGTVLYSNTTGSNGTITLYETAVNFNYLEIFFRDQELPEYSSVKVYSPNNKSVNLAIPTTNANLNGFYIKEKTMCISGTSISSKYYCEATYHINPTIAVKKSNFIYITRVVGYR